MSIEVTATGVPITVSASGTKIEATVSGGVGPQGPPGPQAASGLPSVSVSGGILSPLVLEMTHEVST